jgi:hypothetical protein
MAMTLSGMFELVVAGRIDLSGKLLWLCPMCGSTIGDTADGDECDRRIIAHCLEHAYEGALSPRARSSRRSKPVCDTVPADGGDFTRGLPRAFPCPVVRTERRPRSSFSTPRPRD